MIRLIAALVLAAALLVPRPGRAQTILDRCTAETCKARLTPDQVIGEAVELLHQKRYSEARPMIEALTQVPELKLQSRFLHGMLAAATGDHKSAAAQYRAILADDPSQTRVRLELAREMLALGQVQSADRQFKIAEQDKDLPDDVARTIRAVRDVIRSKRAWRLDVDFGIAPDSNINNATGADTVTILWGGYQLPLTLNSQAKARSGTGETATLSTGLKLPVSKETALLVDVDANGNNYSGTRFDDYSAQIATGAEFAMSPTSSFSMEAVGADRWYGGHLVSTQVGGKLGVQAHLGRASQIGIQLDVRHTDARFDHNYDGMQTGVYATYERAVAKALVASGGAFVRRDWLTAPAYSSAEVGVIAGFGGELRHGITFGVSGTASRAVFDAPMPLFSLEPRKDWRFSARATLGDRKIALLGFSPELGVSYSRIDSTIPYYSNDRLRFRIALARYF